MKIRPGFLFAMLLFGALLISQQAAAEEYRYHLTFSLYRGGDRVPSTELTNRSGLKQVGAGSGVAWEMGAERSITDKLAISLSLGSMLNFTSIYKGPEEAPGTSWATRHIALTALYRYRLSGAGQLRYGLGLTYHIDTSVIVADVNNEQEWKYDNSPGYQILLEYLSEDYSSYILSYNKVEHTARSLPTVDGTNLGLSYRWYF